MKERICSATDWRLEPLEEVKMTPEGRMPSLVLVGAGPHGLEPFEAGRPLYVLGPGPAQDNGSLGNLLRGERPSASIDMNGIWCDGLKLRLFCLCNRKEV